MSEKLVFTASLYVAFGRGKSGLGGAGWTSWPAFGSIYGRMPMVLDGNQIA